MMRITQRRTLRTTVFWSVLVLAAVALLIDGSIFAQRQLRDKNGQLRNQNELLGPRDGIAGGPLAFRNVARLAFPSIVSIETFGRGSASCRGVGPIHNRGSGFVIAPGDGIITSSRLVAGADRVRIRLSDGTTYLASSVATDPVTDLAVLKFSPALNIPALPLANSDATEIGDWVLAVGNRTTPYLLINEQVSAGVISSRGPGPGLASREDLLQTDIPFDTVSPGAPLLNLNGEVVGVHTALGANSDVAHGGVVVPSNLLNRISRQLIENGTVNRAFLGVSTQPVDSRMAQQLRLPANRGALVNQVLPNSPAADAKIQTGDVVQTINGINVTDGHRLQSLADDLPVGVNVPVEVIRNGKSMTLNVVPTAVPAAHLPSPLPGQRSLDTTPSRPLTGFNDLGAVVKPLTPETTPTWFKQPNTRGVLIASVQPGSPAADAGLHPGMIIEKIGASTVASPAEMGTVKANWAGDSGVLMLVRNSRGSRFLIVGGNK